MGRRIATIGDQSDGFAVTQDVTLGLVAFRAGQPDVRGVFLLGAKDLTEVVELHNGFARARLDKVIAETAKLTELSVQVTNEAIEPLQNRVDVTVETLLKAQAA